MLVKGVQLKMEVHFESIPNESDDQKLTSADMEAVYRSRRADFFTIKLYSQ